MAQPSVPMSMLLTRDVPYEWHDGVALVAQLIAQLRVESSGSIPDEIPDLKDMAFDETGWLSIVSHPGAPLPAMPGAAQVLQQLLSGRDQPPPLRLFVMQAASSETMSLEEFTDELAKWERPNRVPKLVALYARALEHIGPAALTEEAMEREQRDHAKLAAPVAPKKKVPSASTERAGASWLTIVLGMVIVVAAAAIAAVEWRYVLDRFIEFEEDEPVAIEEVTPPAEQPAAKPTPPRRTTVAVTAPTPAPLRPVVPVVETIKSADVITAETEMARAQELFNQQDYARARTAFARVLDSLRNERSPQAEEIRRAARNLEEVARAAATDAVVTSSLEFRAGDQGVVEPVPQVYLPPKPDPRTPAEELQVMEVRINAEGKVDSAKFVINRPSFRNSWWTSAAKAWRFQPAMKDGKPVRYVMRIVMDDSDGQR